MKLSPKQMLLEFKDFAFKGNMIDLAVGVVLGSAFAKVVHSLVKYVVMPVVGYLPGLKGDYQTWHIGKILFGQVLSELVSFTATALAVFVVMVKLLGGVMKAAHAKTLATGPTVKECPRCFSKIAINATKCAYCTVDLDDLVGGLLGDKSSG